MLLQILLQAQDVEEIRSAAAARDASAPVRLPPLPIVAGAWKRDLRTCYDTQLPVVANQGWRFVNFEVVNGREVYKPGYLANVTGAVLDVRVRTRFESLPLERGVSLSLRFLTSYEHMGSMSFACVRGCVCANLTLEGHVGTGPAHVSLQHSVSTPVTQSAACTLRFRVRNETASGERKVKLMGVTIRAPI